MAGRRRLILAEITTSSARGSALKNALGKMNEPSTDYEKLAKGLPKRNSGKKK